MLSSSEKFNCESSVLFKDINGKLYQRIDISIPEMDESELTFSLNGDDIHYESIVLTKNRRTTHNFFIPEIKKPTKCRVTFQRNSKSISKEIILYPQKKWEVHLVHFSHTDTGYTDLPSRVARNHGRFLRDILKFCRYTVDYPDEAKFHWTFETGYQFKNAWERISAEEQEETIKYIKEGRIELTPIFLAHTSEQYDYEVLARTLNYITKFCRKYDLPLKSAMNTDITGLPWGLVQVLAGNGIRYLTTGVNSTRGRAPKVHRPFYWGARDGSRVLVWDTDPNNSYIEGTTLGFTRDYNIVLDKLPRYLKRYNDKNFPYDIIGFRTAGANADNANPVLEISNIVKKWNEEWVFPRVLFSTNSNFMEALEKRGGDKFPVVKKAWQDYWVDTYGTVARETAVCRNAHEMLATSEKISSLINIHDKNFRYPKEEFDDIYFNMTMADEPDTCAAQGVSDPDNLQSKGQLHEQATFVYRGAITANETQYLAHLAFPSIIKTKKNSILIFNPLSWKRTDIVQVEIPKKYLNGKHVIIKNSNDEILATVKTGEDVLSVKYSFIVRDIPPFGYLRYFVEFCDKPTDKPKNIHVKSKTIENQFYKIAYKDDGTIGSIFDKDAQCELVNNNDTFGFNQLIYEETVGERKPVSFDNFRDLEQWSEPDLDFMDLSHKLSPERFPRRDTKFNRICPTLIENTKIDQNELFTDISNRVSFSNITRADRTVRLYHDIKRIDFLLNMDKREVRRSEAIYLAFPFLLYNFQLEMENAYSFLKPEQEQLPGSCRDWYLVQKWIRIFNEKLSVFWSPIEAPLVQLSDIQTGKWLHNLDLKKSTIYSWLFNNYWWTNIPASQGGWDYTFRYSLSSSAGQPDRIKSFKHGWNHHSPLMSWFVADENNGKLPEDKFNFCEIDKDNVVVTSIKKAEDGDGFILRLYEITGKNTSVNVKWNSVSIKDAYFTDIVENNKSKVDVINNQINLKITSFSIITLRVMFK